MEIGDELWTSGLCSTFAVALQRRFGGELWAIVNHSRKYPDDDNLWHCYCVIDGVAYDALGAHPLEEASDTTRWPIPEMDRACDAVMLWMNVNEKWIESVHENYDPDDIPAAMEFVNRHRSRFVGLLGLGREGRDRGQR